MKKVLLGLFVVLLAGALVISCDSNATTVVDETTTVSFSTAMDRSLSSSVAYMDFADLDWYYQAIPATGAEFTHGATDSWTKLNSGLSTTIELSQGIWTFKLQARMRNSEEAVYEGLKSGVLIKKQSTPIPVTINVTPVEGGNGTIKLSGITIKGIEADQIHNANKAVIDGTTVIALDGTDKSETVPAGNHSIVVSYEVNGILYGSETIAVTVYSGATVTISGFISEDSQSATFVPNLDAPVTVFSKQLPVDSISSDKTKATVTAETEVSNKDFKVTYPAGTPIVDANADVATNTADAKTGFKYVGDTLSASSGSISISSSESVAQYELTLNVAPNNDRTLVKIEKLIEKNLVITKVLHNGDELEKTAAPDGSPAREYYEYSKDTGKLTLYVFHASPIDIITAKTAHLPEGTLIVTDVPSLRSALRDGADYIALGCNIDLTNWGESESATALLNGRPAVLDLNGFTVKGEIDSGNISCTASETDLTIVDSSSEKTGQIISKFSECTGGTHLNGDVCSGYEMLQATALSAWQQAITINGGKYLSNNVAINCQVQNTSRPEGIIINDGFFGGSDELIEGYSLPGPVGGCVSAVIGTVTINGGTFKAAQYGSVIKVKSGSSNVDTVVNIHGGTFEGACMFDFGQDHSSKSIINVYGGTFTVKNPDKSETIAATSFAYDNYKHAALENNDMFELNIMGGTFNFDPSNYLAEGYFAYKDGDKWQVGQKAMDVSFDNAEDAIEFCADCYNNPGSNHSAHNIYLIVNKGVAEVKRTGAWVSFSNLDWENKRYVLEYDVDLSDLKDGCFVAFDSGETKTWQDNHLGFKKEGSSFVAYNTLFKTSINDTTKIGEVREKVHITYTYSYSVEDEKLTMKMEIVDGTKSYSKEKTVEGFNTEASLCWDVYTVDGESSTYAKLDNFVFGSIDL